MKTLMLRSPFIHPFTILTSPKSYQQLPSHNQLLSSPFPRIPSAQTNFSLTNGNKPALPNSEAEAFLAQNTHLDQASDNSKYVVLGAVSVGVMMFLMGMDGQKALALGPEGPLMEEFWDNVRRYGLYILTVSSGALYTIFQPIFELLKNPISAILVLTILGGGFFIVAQVVSAMIGATDFDYQYYY